MMEIMNVLIGVVSASEGNIETTAWVPANSLIAQLARNAKCSSYVMLIDDMLYVCSIC